jgi:hypothetical protein
MSDWQNSYLDCAVDTWDEFRGQWEWSIECTGHSISTLFRSGMLLACMDCLVNVLLSIVISFDTKNSNLLTNIGRIKVGRTVLLPFD